MIIIVNSFLSWTATISLRPGPHWILPRRAQETAIACGPPKKKPPPEDRTKAARHAHDWFEAVRNTCACAESFAAEELSEARFELLPHHVVALASDRPPCDKRDILWSLVRESFNRVVIDTVAHNEPAAGLDPDEAAVAHNEAYKAMLKVCAVSYRQLSRAEPTNIPKALKDTEEMVTTRLFTTSRQQCWTRMKPQRAGCFSA